MQTNNTQYVIGSNSHWRACNAKTLTGAKRCATKYYYKSLNGKIEVAEKTNDNFFEVKAILYGYDKKWTNTY